jgi:hypothetical protein
LFQLSQQWQRVVRSDQYQTAARSDRVQGAEDRCVPDGVWHVARVELGHDRIRVLVTAATLTPASALGVGVGVGGRDLAMILRAEKLMHAVQDVRQ